MEEFNLRPLCQGDMDAFFALTADPQVAKYMRFACTPNREAAAALLADILSGPAFAVEIGGALGGVFSLKPLEGGCYCISTFLAPAHWGKGYSTKILADRMAYAKKKLHAKKLLAYITGDNFGSRRIMEKLAFTLGEILDFDDLPGGLYVYEKYLGRAQITERN